MNIQLSKYYNNSDGVVRDLYNNGQYEYMLQW
jgi:hypothetical protein